MKRAIDPRTEKLAYSVPEVAVALGIGELTVWQLIREGEIASFKIGILTRISKANLDGFIARRNTERLGHPDIGRPRKIAENSSEVVTVNE